MKYSELSFGDFFVLNNSDTCACYKMHGQYIMFPDEVISDDPDDSDSFLKSIEKIDSKKASKITGMSVQQMMLRASFYGNRTEVSE